jgi:valyl-tRNA synthetase
MDSKYQPQLVEEKIYKEWEEKELFKAKVNKNKKPFSIILPPPNANGSLHLGHAMFTYEDIMIRFNKMMGKETLWLLGLDHAGTETQFVFEKQLKKQGKSRYDYKRDELYKMIWDYVAENKSTIKNQLKRLGFALDWSKEKFTMDPAIVKIVYKTFEDLFNEGLIYRANKLINYCTNCGTSFSDLEVVYVERTDSLYYMKYGPFTLATTRPETKFGDTAIAVHPDDKRYQKWIGKEIEVEGLIGKFKVIVVGDKAVDPKFGTGAVKVTPAHDFNDYEIAKRHNLPMKQVIGFDGKLNELAGKYQGLRIFSARQQVVADLQAKGQMVKIKEDYVHRVGTCYRCGKVLEPLPKNSGL